MSGSGGCQDRNNARSPQTARQHAAFFPSHTAHRCITFRWESEVQIQAPTRINLHAHMGSCASTKRLYPEVLQYVTYMHKSRCRHSSACRVFLLARGACDIGLIKIKNMKSDPPPFFPALFCLSFCWVSEMQIALVQPLPAASERGRVYLYLPSILFVFTNCWLPHSEVSEKEKFS